jgi:hypothetical protein
MENLTCDSDLIQDECVTTGEMTPYAQCMLSLFVIADGFDEDLDKFLYNMYHQSSYLPKTEIFRAWSPDEQDIYDEQWFQQVADLNVPLARGTCQYVNDFEDAGTDKMLSPDGEGHLSREAQCILLLEYVSCCLNPRVPGECGAVIVGDASYDRSTICEWTSASAF